MQGNLLMNLVVLIIFLYLQSEDGFDCLHIDSIMKLILIPRTDLSSAKVNCHTSVKLVGYLILDIGYSILDNFLSPAPMSVA